MGGGNRRGDRPLIVLDSSAAVHFLLWSTPERIGDILLGETVRVPAHFDAEVFSAVRRLLLRGAIAEPLAEGALLQTARLLAERVPLAGLLADAYALRNRFSAYDAFYVALARKSSAVLLTRDAPLARAARALVEVQLALPA